MIKIQRGEKEMKEENWTNEGNSNADVSRRGMLHPPLFNFPQIKKKGEEPWPPPLNLQKMS